ncbi:unnamed protein product [Angiostrongylus costaricensis]|uniref:Uncharacterized protein n=1 Tax=Angiostrongylus costaricensis TaxID=334426 RepID=A0A0R3PMT4_ANGCS|nr:unnamed protein product [Angiostrongylus costaricensis]
MRRRHRIEKTNGCGPSSRIIDSEEDEDIERTGLNPDGNLTLTFRSGLIVVIVGKIRMDENMPLYVSNAVLSSC